MIFHRHRFPLRRLVAPQIVLRYSVRPRLQSISSRSRWCAAKHPDGYRDTIY